MARIPEYTKTVFLDRVNPGNIEAAGAAYGGNKARGLEMDAARYGRNAEKADAFADQIRKQKDVQGQLKAQETFNELERKRITAMQDMQNHSMTSPDGFAKKADEWYQLEQNNVEEALQAKEDDQPFDLAYFRQLTDRTRTSALQQNNDWENGMRVKNIAVSAEENLDQMNVNFAMNSPTIGDLPGQYQKVRDYANTIGANVLDPAQNHQLFRYGADRASAAVMDSMLDQDPKSLDSVMNYGSGSKNSVIDFVMFKLEGGDKVVPDGDGSVAKYGINSKFNPGVDVKGLTAEGARQIYASKFWDARLEKYDDPAFRAVAFDALVQHGNDKDTWAMIQKSKGDPYALIAARQNYYASLVFSDPAKNAKNAKGWENRMRNLTSFVQTMEGGGKEFLQHSALMDPDMIQRVRNALPAAMAAKDREAEAEQRQKITDYNTAYKSLYDTMTNDLEPVGAQELNTLKQMAVNTGTEEAIAQADAVANQNTYVKSLKGLGEDQLRKIVSQASAEVNKNPGPESRLKLELTQGVLDNQTKAIPKEGLAYFGRTGQIKMPQPINYGDPRAAAYELRSREDSSLAVFQKTGKLMPVLTPDEIDGLKEQFATMPANDMAGVLSSFDALDQMTKNNLSKAIDQKSPVIATALSVDNLEARRRILQGAKMEPKYEKKDMAAVIYAELDPMVVDPEFKAGAVESVMAWYNSKAAEDRDFSETIDSGRIDDAITQIYGPRVDLAFYGTNKVFTFKDPATDTWVNENDFYNSFNDMTDDQLTKVLGELPTGALGETVHAADIKENGRIVSAGDGLYNVVFDGIGGLYGKDGNLIEIDGRKLLDLYRKGRK